VSVYLFGHVRERMILKCVSLVTGLYQILFSRFKGDYKVVM
jgi:hypothetical protein